MSMLDWRNYRRQLMARIGEIARFACASQNHPGLIVNQPLTGGFMCQR